LSCPVCFPATSICRFPKILFPYYSVVFFFFSRLPKPFSYCLFFLRPLQSLNGGRFFLGPLAERSPPSAALWGERSCRPPYSSPLGFLKCSGMKLFSTTGRRRNAPADYRIPLPPDNPVSSLWTPLGRRGLATAIEKGFGPAFYFPRRCFPFFPFFPFFFFDGSGHFLLSSSRWCLRPWYSGLNLEDLPVFSLQSSSFLTGNFSIFTYDYVNKGRSLVPFTPVLNFARL